MRHTPYPAKMWHPSGGDKPYTADVPLNYRYIYRLTCNGCRVSPTAERWSRQLILSTPITNTPIAEPEGPAGVLNLFICHSHISYIGSIQYTFGWLLRPSGSHSCYDILAVSPLSPINEEKVICHHTSTRVIAPANR